METASSLAKSYVRLFRPPIFFSCVAAIRFRRDESSLRCGNPQMCRSSSSAGPLRMALRGGTVFADDPPPPNREKIPPVEDPWYKLQQGYTL